MSVAIFDLDNTLLAGDSDHGWGEFMIQKNLVEGDSYHRQNDEFYRAYKDGTLDIYAYQEFVLAPLTAFSLDQLNQMHAEFMERVIAPMILPKALALIEKHRSEGDTLLIITATNRFVTAPIAKKLGIEHLLATEAEIKNNRYSGRIVDIPCFQHGKVERLKRWLQEQQLSLSGSWFYSDSINDVPLLNEVDNPVAVDPDNRLREFAMKKNWPIISLR